VNTIVVVMSRGVLPINKIDADTRKNCISAIMTCNKYRAQYIVTCGGIFNNKKIQTQPIARLMKKYIKKIYELIDFIEDKEWGDIYVKPKRIIAECRSLDTYQNVEFMNKIFKKTGIHKNDHIVICSDYLHYIRTKILFKNLGYNHISYSEFSANNDYCKICLSFKRAIKEFVLICMTKYDPGLRKWPVKNIMEKERGKRKNSSISI